jgi:hypothetical protein
VRQHLTRAGHAAARPRRRLPLADTLGSVRKKILVAALLSVLVEAVVVGSRRGRFFAVDTVVRCRHGHLFTTMWIPGASVKSVRLGWWRFQYCPAGGHWTLVTPAYVSELDDDQRRDAAAVHDVRIP